MRKTFMLAAATSAALLSAAVPAAADAAVTLTRYDFSGTFQDDAIIPRISGYFTIEKDSAQTDGTLFDVDVTIGSTRFTKANSGGAFLGDRPDDRVARAGGITGNEFDTFTNLSTGTNDYAVVILLDAPTESYFFYTLENWAGLGEAYGQDGGFTFTATDITGNAVPEPASWALMISGFGLVGGAMRRRSVTMRYATA